METLLKEKAVRVLSLSRLDELHSIDLDHVRQALTIRRVEERLLSLFAEGRLFGTVHTCVGQEWAAVAVMAALEPGDFICSNHRGHGHYLAHTDDVEGLIAELMGRQAGVCGGRGGSQHLHKESFFSNGVQGGLTPVATGMALAQQLESKRSIAVVFIGDGTWGQGTVYESLNIAARWSLPLLIVVEDNGIAQSTPRDQHMAGTIAGRAAAFDIPCREAATDDPTDLITQAADAVREVRIGRRPLVLHIHTQRLNAHSKGDDDRDPRQLAEMTADDPTGCLLAEQDPCVLEVLEAIDARIGRAVAVAESSPFTELNLRESPAASRPVAWQPLHFAEQRISDAIRQGLHSAMEANSRVMLLGEDIADPYGGAFKVTAGLSTCFPQRVRNCPISEAAIVGMANGLALAGWQPVVEIMFGDFLLLAADQFVNHAAKFAWMFDEQVRVPTVIRTPMGGYRGYGPTHSQCLEKHFLGVPGTRVLALHRRYCPQHLYWNLLTANSLPTLVLENKTCYSQSSQSRPPAGYELLLTNEPFGTVRLRPTCDAHITLVAYGGMVEQAEQAMKLLAETEDVVCDLLIPTQLYPLDIAPILESLRQTRRLLVVEEGQAFCGWAGELIARLSCEGQVDSWKAARVSAAACPIPASKPAELLALPDASRIAREATRLVVE